MVAGFASYLLRLVGYAIILGIATRIADAMWVQDGLDSFGQLQTWHGEGLTAMTWAPIVIAFISLAAPRIALFLAFLAIGAVLSEPYAFARMMQ